MITENETILSILKYGKAMNKESIGFPEGVIKGFLKAVKIMQAAKDMGELLQYRGLHYERLKGDKKGYESVRCNNKYRLLFRHYVSYNKKEVIKITTIDLIKISNHYGDL